MPLLRSAVWSVDSNVPIRDLRTMDEVVPEDPRCFYGATSRARVGIALGY